MKNKRKRVLVTDFDGVIAEYNHWVNSDTFGPLIEGCREILGRLKEKGWLIIIFTTRKITPKLVEYLTMHQIPYDVLNGWQRESLQRHFEESSLASYLEESACSVNRFFWQHDHPNTDFKPRADVYLDDKDWQSLSKKWNWQRVYNRLKEIFPDEL